MIPLPRPRLLTSALLIGTAVGLLLGIGLALVVSAKIRPDVVIALVVGVPGAIGMLTIVLSRRRWVTAVARGREGAELATGRGQFVRRVV